MLMIPSHQIQCEKSYNSYQCIFNRGGTVLILLSRNTWYNQYIVVVGHWNDVINRAKGQNHHSSQ